MYDLDKLAALCRLAYFNSTPERYNTPVQGLPFKELNEDYKNRWRRVAQAAFDELTTITITQ